MRGAPDPAAHEVRLRARTELPAHLQAARRDGPAGEVRIALTPAAFASALREVLGADAVRFITIFVTDGPDPQLSALAAFGGELLVLQTPIGDHELTLSGPLGRTAPAIQRAVRELIERDPRLSAHPHRRRLMAASTQQLQPEVAGQDVFTIPFGPVRSGVFEAIRFEIETGGEDVLRVQTQGFFKHRGIEARLKRLRPEVAVIYAERVAGIASTAYASAFSQAVERALGVEPPPRAQRWRAVLCELERIACHLDVIAKQAETAALAVALARFQILKERVLRLQGRATGSRFGRGLIAPGGLRAEPMLSPARLLDEIEALESDLRRDQRLFAGTLSMTDRLVGTGVLERALVERAGAVGPLARGSGVSTDARHERPYGEYRKLGLRVMVRREGDSMARVQVRFDEAFEAIRMIRQAAQQLQRSDDELLAELPQQGDGAACGWVESPQGELLVWVEIATGMVSNVHIADPSFRNWALFESAFPKDVLTDFGFIEHSFGLSPAGADR